MARPKRTNSKKKPSQVGDAGGDDAVPDRNVVLTDGDANNGGNVEAGGSGLQDQGRKSDSESRTDSSVEDARKRLQKKRSRIVSLPSDGDDEEDRVSADHGKGKGKGKGKSSSARNEKERREREKEREREAEEDEDRNI